MVDLKDSILDESLYAPAGKMIKSMLKTHKDKIAILVPFSMLNDALEEQLNKLADTNAPCEEGHIWWFSDSKQFLK